MNLELLKHKLTYIPRLQINDNLFSVRFKTLCSTSNCEGVCCNLGVYVDIKERDKILQHAEVIQRHMQPHQVHDSNEWFEQNEFDDPDFPSGRAVGTQVKDYGCVFLDEFGKCTLQKACSEEGLHQYFLKPFYCIAFPITIDKGVLMIDDIELQNRHQCRIIDDEGTLNVFEVCSNELEFVLGKEGYDELKNIFSIYSGFQ